MSNDEFQALFDAVYQGIPGYAKNSIEAYLKKGVKSEIAISEEAADKAQEHGKIKVPAAGLVAFETNWYYVFRPFVLETAPVGVLRTIVQHEIIEGFLISAEHSDVKEAIAAIEGYKGQLVKMGQTAGIKLPKDYNITEDFVCFINDQWGGNEIEAKDWLTAQLKQKQKEEV